MTPYFWNFHPFYRQTQNSTFQNQWLTICSINSYHPENPIHKNNYYHPIHPRHRHHNHLLHFRHHHPHGQFFHFNFRLVIFPFFLNFPLWYVCPPQVILPNQYLCSTNLINYFDSRHLGRVDSRIWDRFTIIGLSYFMRSIIIYLGHQFGLRLENSL